MRFKMESQRAIITHTFPGEGPLNAINDNGALEEGELRKTLQIKNSSTTKYTAYTVSIAKIEKKQEISGKTKYRSIKEIYNPFYELMKLKLLERQIKYLRENFAKVSEATRSYIIDIVDEDMAGEFTPPQEPEPCIYDMREPDETTEDFIIRLYPDVPRTWSKLEDGDVIEFIKNHFQGKTGYNFIDGEKFNRYVLKRINPQLNKGLANWLQATDPNTKEKNQLPDDLPIPHKRGQAKEIIKNLSPEEIQAVLAIKNHQ